MKKLFALLLTLAMVLASVSAFAATPVAATELAYKGDLTLMHFSTSEESEGNGGSDGFRTTIAAWQAAHPDINLVQDVLANAEYKTTIATRAAAGDLPDVFLLQGDEEMGAGSLFRGARGVLFAEVVRIVVLFVRTCQQNGARLQKEPAVGL